MGKMMAASIVLTKEWVAVEHPSIDLFNYDRFLSQDGKKKKAAKQIKTFRYISAPRREGKGTSHSK